MGTNYYLHFTDKSGVKQMLHLGKTSCGWQFLWNFHNNKYYSNSAELTVFVQQGKIESEYEEMFTCESFLSMALQKIGLMCEDERVVDGLQVSRYTDFC